MRQNDATRRDFFAWTERLMSMDDTVWARHANPLSVYSRIAGGTAVFLAVWSPYWLGWWGAVLIALAAMWIWLNPRLFPPPEDTKSWATRGVLGERVFLNRKKVPVPEAHRRVALIATGCAAAFLGLTILGLVKQEFWLAFTAWHASTVAKLWFCDRMVWLWDDMKAATPVYRAWDEARWNLAPEDGGQQVKS